MGLVLVLEGIPYFVAPERMRRVIVQIAELPDPFLRRAGLVLMIIGFMLVYMIRG